MARTVDILLISSSPDDVERIRSALDQAVAEHAHTLHVVDDGPGALDFLRREGSHNGASRPDLIILDLDASVQSGWLFLQERSGERRLRSIPVVVLSGSVDGDAIARSYQLQANSYVHKPADASEFQETIATIKRFWLDTVRLPRKERLSA